MYVIVKEREDTRTPSPQLSQLASPDFETLIILRQVKKVAGRIDKALEEVEDLDEDLTWNINRFIKGALITAPVLIQTKRDLNRTPTTLYLYLFAW